MVAWELLTGRVTAPSTTKTALTMHTGNSLTVRDTEPGVDVRLIQAWSDNQGAGELQIRGPEFGNNVNGIDLHVVASEVYPLLPWDVQEKLRRNQVITALLSGSATAGDIESAALLVYYERLQGIEGRFITHTDLQSRAKHLVTVENTLATGTAGGYSGEEAINAEEDVLNSDTQYALVGYLVDAECAAVRWRGSETGNLGVGGPGHETNRSVTRAWFIELSKMTGLPAIPVFTWDNKANILIDAVQDENGTDVLVKSIFAELA